MDPREDARPLAIALMGPTASGKTALALDWAQRLGTEVISVDSALVYRGLNIGAAKPDPETLRRIPHRLVDVRDPHETYSAADFATDALAAMREVSARGRIPLLAGGTMLYFHALLRGLSPMPAADPALRRQLASELATRGAASLHAELASHDASAAARIHANDPQRLLRALEVFRLSGRPISEWQRQVRAEGIGFRVLRLVLCPAQRAVLHARIEARFDAMLAAGLLDEVSRLRSDPRLHPDLPSMRAVGYRQAWQHLDAKESAAEFRARAIAATRQLAKRQLTWLRGELDARWLDPLADRAELEIALGRFVTRR